LKDVHFADSKVIKELDEKYNMLVNILLSLSLPPAMNATA